MERIKRQLLYKIAGISLALVLIGSCSWFLSGAPDNRWDEEDLISMRDVIKGSDFEAVYTGPTKTTY